MSSDPRFRADARNDGARRSGVRWVAPRGTVLMAGGRGG